MIKPNITITVTISLIEKFAALFNKPEVIANCKEARDNNQTSFIIFHWSI